MYRRRPLVPVAFLVPLVAFAPAARADVVSCGAAIPPEVVCLTGNVSDTSGGGPLVAGKVYHTGGFTVPNGQTLTLEDGAILKVGNFVTVDGTLVAKQATITSLADDSAGGDTNGDGTSFGAPGDWDGLVFQGSADASRLEGTAIRFATTGVALLAADVLLDTVTVSDCTGIGFELNGNSFPTVVDSSFVRNDLAVNGVPFGALPGFTGNGASQNTSGDYMRITSTTILTNMTLGPGNSLDGGPFVVCRTITIPAGLTVNVLPGTIIKFGFGPVGGTAGCGLDGLTVDGTLVADGLTLTSLADDTVSGDTNKDGALTLPAPGDWGPVTFTSASDASLLRNSTIRYAGQAPLFQPGPSIDLSFADVTLDTVIVELGSIAGLRLNTNSFPTVDGCTFRMHSGVAVERASLGAVAGFTNNTASMNAGGDYIELLGTGRETVTGSVTLLQANSLNASGLFVVDDDVTVDDTGDLTLGSGVVLKWTTPDNHHLLVDGTLSCDGTGLAPIVFTSLPDDSVLGDSNKDGGATQPAPGDWIGITFQPGSNASVLDEVLVRYGGQDTFTTGAVTLSGSSPTITASILEFSESAGLSLLGAAFPSVSGCDVRQNARAVTGVAIGAVPGFSNNTASGNAAGDYLEIVEGDVSFAPSGPGAEAVALTIGPGSALLPAQVFVVDTDIDVPAGCVLSMLAGTILKWNGVRELDVDGSVQLGSLGDPVVLTTLADDSVGGDTPKDGPTSGTPGEWVGVNVSANGSFLDDVVVRFAGGFGPAFEITGGSTATLLNVCIEDCAATALHLFGSALPVIDSCAFERNVFAVDGVPLRALPGFSNNTATDNTIGDYLRITDASVATDLIVSASQSLGGIPFVLADDVDVLAGATLTLNPSVVFKFEGTYEVDVDGTLNTIGGGQNVIFTTLFDDIAGDTNKDGTFTAPGPGAWRGLTFGSASDASVLQGARVRYAGNAGVAAIDLLQSDLTLVDSLVERAAAQGLDLSGNSFPQVRRTSFDDGIGLPVDGAPLKAVAGFTDNVASGNAAGDVLRVTTASVVDTVNVARRNALNDDGVFLMNTGVSVSAAGVLELGRGTTLKFEGSAQSVTVTTGAVNVRGTGLEPVVLTSVDDDAVGGDTRKDGATTAPAPGDWGRFSIGSTAGASLVEHLIARYGGAGSIDLDSATATARSIRSDFAAGDGIQVSRLAGDAANWVAFQSGGDGLDVTGGAFDIVHATVVGAAGVGVARGVSHVGVLASSILHDNAGGATSGLLPGEVFSSNAGPAFAGSDGNIDADPLFRDPVAGDLRLRVGSPSVDAGDAARALAVVEDHVEAPRVLDDDLDGVALPDMGAFERAAYTLSFGGRPRAGTSMGFHVAGPPGRAVYVLGLLGGTTFHDPFGFTLYGARGSGALVGVAPTGKTVTLDLPLGITPVGTEFGVQALVQPLAVPTAVDRERSGGDAAVVSGVPVQPVGNYTNLYRGVVFQ